MEKRRPSDRWVGIAVWPIFLLIFSAGAVSAWCSGPVQKRVLRDTLGRTVAAPARAERILSLQPEITRILVALGAGERLVGLDYFITRDDHLFKIIFPEGARLPVVSQPDESVNKELVVRLDPDIIFTSPAEQQVPDSIERSLGIPVAAIASMGRFEKLLEEIELVGALTGLEGRAEELVRYFRRKIQFVSDSVGDLPQEMRPRVYLAFWSSLLRTPVFYEPVNTAGGRNVAENLLPSYSGALGTIINIEQILKWDPEVILIHGNYLPAERQITVEGVSEDKRLRSVRAVLAKRVHYTFGFWYWWDPAAVLAETLYLARLFHPENFRSLDLEKEGNAIFEMFYLKKNVFSTLLRTLDFDDWTNP
ncbi:MAG: ABC transporter substrate-binding protein [Candidatus Aminicenantes bacterium]|nr:ABC transporter substrate-binding protein [Candidatus Aminicenantes bacterium]